MFTGGTRRESERVLSGLYAVLPLPFRLQGHMFMIRKFPHRTSKTMLKGAEVTVHD